MFRPRFKARGRGRAAILGLLVVIAGCGVVSGSSESDGSPNLEDACSAPDCQSFDGGIAAADGAVAADAALTTADGSQTDAGLPNADGAGCATSLTWPISTARNRTAS